MSFQRHGVRQSQAIPVLRRLPLVALRERFDSRQELLLRVSEGGGNLARRGEPVELVRPEGVAIRSPDLLELGGGRRVPYRAVREVFGDRVQEPCGRLCPSDQFL